MKLGRVFLKFEYTVDLDNKEMVQYAEESICEDIDNLVKHDEVFEAIDTEETPDAKESDIPEFLQEYAKEIAKED